MTFIDLAKYLDNLEHTSSRIEITKILSELFGKTDKEEIDKTVYLLLGLLAPNYRSIVFNLAERMMIKVLAETYETSVEEVRKSYKLMGDLGSVAEKLAQKSKIKNQKSKLTIFEVYDSLVVIATDEGEGSVDRKIDSFSALLSRLDPLSAKYVVRIPLGALRLGFSDKTILDALSWLEFGDKRAKPLLDRAYEVTPDVGLLAKNVKQLGVAKATKDVKPVIGIPVAPMLAQRIKSTDEMIAKMGKVAIEPKFDGLRLLIHYKKPNFIKAFTRNLNDVSEMFPELLSIGKYLRAKEVILDAETVGMDPTLAKIVDFQTVMQRRRKHDIEILKNKIPVAFQIFDLIYKDGRSYMSEPYLNRRAALEETVTQNATFVVDDYWLTDKPQDINKKHQEMIDDGLEGVIVKRVDSKYVPGRTGWRWVKMKEAAGEQGKLADTIDCVVMGFSSGKGKRASFGVGQFLVGVTSGDRFKTVTKIGTGLTDNEFREISKRLSKIRVGAKPSGYDVHKNLEPDTWVTPSVVVEIAADNITISPTHTAGYALRFPRLVRFRDDKSPNQATTVTEIKKLYKIQKGYVA